MICLQDALFEMILDVEPVNVYMLHSVMIHRVMGYINNRFVVAADYDWLDIGNP